MRSSGHFEVWIARGSNSIHNLSRRTVHRVRPMSDGLHHIKRAGGFVWYAQLPTYLISVQVSDK
jgi:hypothetical protein